MTRLNLHSFEFLMFCHQTPRPGDHAVSTRTVLYQDLLFVLMSRWWKSCQLCRCQWQFVMFPGHVFLRIYTYHHCVDNLRSCTLGTTVKLSTFEMVTVLILCMGVNQECTNPRLLCDYNHTTARRVVPAYTKCDVQLIKLLLMMD